MILCPMYLLGDILIYLLVYLMVYLVIVGVYYGFARIWFIEGACGYT